MRPVARSYELAGGTWWAVTGRYATAKMAEGAYQRILRKLRVGEIGFYRHGLPEEGGVLITAIGIKESEIRRAMRLLGDAADEDLDRHYIEAMAARRARVVLDAYDAGSPAGRIKIRHAGRGARLDEKGHMHESGGGRG
jgi:hypothetical protein